MSNHDCKDKDMDEFCCVCVAEKDAEIARLKAALRKIAGGKQITQFATIDQAIALAALETSCTK